MALKDLQLRQAPQNDDIDAVKEIIAKHAKIEVHEMRPRGYPFSPISGHEVINKIAAFLDSTKTMFVCLKAGEGTLIQVARINMLLLLSAIEEANQKPPRVQELRREVLVLKKLKSQRVTALHEASPKCESHSKLSDFRSRVFQLRLTFIWHLRIWVEERFFEYIRDRPESLMEEEARRLFHDIATGLRDLHRADIANRNIKTQNVVLDETKRIAKICDLASHDPNLRHVSGSSEPHSIKHWKFGNFRWKIVTTHVATANVLMRGILEL